MSERESAQFSDSTNQILRALDGESVTRNPAFSATTNAILDAIEEGGGSGLPEVTDADDGKVLTVVDGEWDAAEPSGGDELPFFVCTRGVTPYQEIVTNYNNGKLPIMIYNKKLYYCISAQSNQLKFVSIVPDGQSYPGSQHKVYREWYVNGAWTTMQTYKNAVIIEVPITIDTSAGKAYIPLSNTDRNLLIPDAISRFYDNSTYERYQKNDGTAGGEGVFFHISNDRIKLLEYEGIENNQYKYSYTEKML